MRVRELEAHQETFKHSDPHGDLGGLSSDVETMWKSLRVTNEQMNSSLSLCQPGDFRSLRKETPW